MNEWTVHNGDCREVMAALPDASVDSVVCDPPYELTAGKKGGSGEASVDLTTPYGRARITAGGGFMGMSWDATGVAFDADTWAEVLRVLKPGGHLLAFGGTRTYHRLAVAIEDAGFEIRDSINWVYGCLTDDVEVLTESGWRHGIDINVGDRVAQWDSDTGTISLAAVADTFRAPWDGPLVAFRNSDTDQLVTPNHRVYWQRNVHRSTNNVERREWVMECSEAADVPRRSQIRLPLAGHHDGPGIGGTDYASLLGWVWTEGHFDATGTGVRVYQSSVNQRHCDTIAALMDRLGAHKRYDRDRTYKGRTYTESTWFVTGDLARRVRTDLPSKHPTYDLLWRMSAAEVEAFYTAAIAGDGHVTGSGSATLEQKDPMDREWFVTLLALSNRRGHDYTRPRGGGSVSVTRSPWTNLTPARMAATDRVFYTGDVWCVRVPTGAFVARRNGKVFITGNSGFPKSHNVSKAIDKAAGAEREIVGTKVGLPGYSLAVDTGRGVAMSGNADGSLRNAEAGCAVTAPATDAARQWEGWGTALKPAHEPIVVARKPLVGTVAANVLEHGTGALNIDGCRVGHTTVAGGNLALNPHLRDVIRGGNGGHVIAHETEVREGSSHTVGRWPANLVLTHAADCDDECATGCPVAELDAQSGELRARGNVSPTKRGVTFGGGPPGDSWSVAHQSGDTGGASRFFTVTEWDEVPFRYVAKASKRERNAGLDDLPEHTIGAKGNGLARTCATCGAGVIDGCDCPDRTFINPARKNHHPTVKPVAVMEWLVRLVTPPDGIVLDPFCGSGTTGIAAVKQGFQFIGIEQNADYVAIAEARIRHAEQQPATPTETPHLDSATHSDATDTPPDDHPTLF